MNESLAAFRAEERDLADWCRRWIAWEELESVCGIESDLQTEGSAGRRGTCWIESSRKVPHGKFKLVTFQHDQRNLLSLKVGDLMGIGWQSRKGQNAAPVRAILVKACPLYLHLILTKQDCTLLAHQGAFEFELLCSQGRRRTIFLHLICDLAWESVARTVFLREPAPPTLSVPRHPPYFLHPAVESLQWGEAAPPLIIKGQARVTMLANLVRCLCASSGASVLVVAVTDYAARDIEGELFRSCNPTIIPDALDKYRIDFHRWDVITIQNCTPDSETILEMLRNEKIPDYEYDVVVLTEAERINEIDAYGALLRGRRAIVVGDADNWYHRGDLQIPILAIALQQKTWPVDNIELLAHITLHNIWPMKTPGLSAPEVVQMSRAQESPPVQDGSFLPSNSSVSSISEVDTETNCSLLSLDWVDIPFTLGNISPERASVPLMVEDSEIPPIANWLLANARRFLRRRLLLLSPLSCPRDRYSARLERLCPDVFAEYRHRLTVVELDDMPSWPVDTFTLIVPLNHRFMACQPALSNYNWLQSVRRLKCRRGFLLGNLDFVRSQVCLRVLLHGLQGPLDQSAVLPFGEKTDSQAFTCTAPSANDAEKQCENSRSFIEEQGGSPIESLTPARKCLRSRLYPLKSGSTINKPDAGFGPTLARPALRLSDVGTHESSRSGGLIPKSSRDVVSIVFDVEWYKDRMGDAKHKIESEDVRHLHFRANSPKLALSQPARPPEGELPSATAPQVARGLTHVRTNTRVNEAAEAVQDVSEDEGIVIITRSSSFQPLNVRRKRRNSTSEESDRSPLAPSLRCQVVHDSVPRDNVVLQNRQPPIFMTVGRHWAPAPYSRPNKMRRYQNYNAGRGTSLRKVNGRHMENFHRWLSRFSLSNCETAAPPSDKVESSTSTSPSSPPEAVVDQDLLKSCSRCQSESVSCECTWCTVRPAASPWDRAIGCGSRRRRPGSTCRCQGGDGGQEGNSDSDEEPIRVPYRRPALALSPLHPLTNPATPDKSQEPSPAVEDSYVHSVSRSPS